MHEHEPQCVLGAGVMVSNVAAPDLIFGVWSIRIQIQGPGARMTTMQGWRWGGARYL